MFNDRPISEIADIIFHMDDDRVARAAKMAEQGIIEGSKTQARKRIQDRKEAMLMKQIEDDEYMFDTPLMDKEYFPDLRK